MLKQPQRFLPVSSGSCLKALVSSGSHGDFRIQDLLTGECYLSFLATGFRFFRIVEQDIFGDPPRIEEVTDKELITTLREAKYKFVDLYFDDSTLAN